MKKKEKEWKDTRLTYCVDYNYSLFVRNRCVFFYGEAPRWRKTLNFALNFFKPWNICVVFLYGEKHWKDETFLSYISKANGNLIVFHFDNIKDELLSTVSDYVKWEKVAIKRGHVHDGSFTESYIAEREKTESAVKAGALTNTDILFGMYQEDRKIIESYREAFILIQKAQMEKARCYSTFFNFSTLSASNESLTNIICVRYPLGVESDTADENCVKIAKINRYIRSALDNNIEMNITLRGEERQLSFFDDSTNGASEIVHVLRDYCRNAIKHRGRFYLYEAWHVIEEAPYGAYECNWYMHLFAYAISAFLKDGFHYLMQYIPHAATEVQCTSIRERFGLIFAISENQRLLAKTIAKLFDCNETIYISCALNEARNWCCNNIQTPLAFVDDRFHDLLDFDCDRWTKKGEEEKFLAWIVKDFENLYSRIRSVDNDFNKMLVSIGYEEQRIQLFRRYSYVKGGAVGWLHTKEMMLEMVKEYMKHEEVCRECGMPIKRHESYVLSSNSSAGNIKHDTLVFNKKDIIGLNKKFLGRYQNEYFCVNCLCEFLGTNEESLYEKVQSFKAAGCELF